MIEKKLHLLAIDITMQCNLKCFNCNRYCDVIPDADHMTLGQINHLINESLKLNYQWDRINISGGEPTEHPYFESIVDMLLAYRDAHSPNTKINLVTNGINKAKVEKYDGPITIISSEKTTRCHKFNTNGVSPVDLFVLGTPPVKYSGCNLTVCDDRCSICLNRFGYYANSICAAIDRLHKFDVAIKKLSDINTGCFDKSFGLLCGYCGLYYNLQTDFHGTVVSKSFMEALEYRANRKDMPLYGE